MSYLYRILRLQFYAIDIGMAVRVFSSGRNRSPVSGETCPTEDESNIGYQYVSDSVAEFLGIIRCYSNVSVYVSHVCCREERIRLSDHLALRLLC